MKQLNRILSISLLALASLTPSTASQKVTTTAVKHVQTLAQDPKLKMIMSDTFSRQMSDESKIIEYNKLLLKYKKPVSNYVVIDKKKCTSTVYTPDGKILYRNEVALGRHIGDKRSGGYKDKKVKLRAYTTPGEFVISRVGTNNKSDQRLYGERVLILSGDFIIQASKGKSTLALHRVPATPQGKLREDVFNNGTTKDNRVSFGCVNYLVKAYDKMRSLIKGKGTKVYILPEEKGNSLHLEKQKDGTYKFFQTKYRTEAQEK